MRGEVIEEPDGSLTLPDGRTYRRTPERIRRRALARDLIAEGAPVVTNVYPEGRVAYDGPDAKTIWDEISPRLVQGRKPAVRDLQWTGTVWSSESGVVMLHFDGQH